MAEAEDLLHDLARHATDYAQGLWQRHRAHAPPPGLTLTDVCARLDLLLTAVFGRSWPIRRSEPPATATTLRRLFSRGAPLEVHAVPATDGSALWLPEIADASDALTRLTRWRTMALQQAMRAYRGSAAFAPPERDALVHACYLMIEAHAADAQLVALLPGFTGALVQARLAALERRPSLTTLSAGARALELLARGVLTLAPGHAHGDILITGDPAQSLAWAQARAAHLKREHGTANLALFADAWTGALRRPPASSSPLGAAVADASTPAAGATRSARLPRAPKVREAREGEDDARQGAWMVQSSPPQEHVEDPMGMQRPTDRDERAAAEDLADSLSELPEARLVATPGRPKEVLLADAPLDAHARRSMRIHGTGEALHYPEWDCHLQAYRLPGARVRLDAPTPGDPAWVTRTLEAHRTLAYRVRRHFEMLRAQRMSLRKQPDGEDIDLDAYIASHAAFRAGQPMSQAIYRCTLSRRRDLAIALLIDVSGSTDAWVDAHRRIVDVEREALLLVCMALEGLAEPYAIYAFSGEGPGAVSLRELKAFADRYDGRVALRIAGLEPEHYTRCGAALRHVSAHLMRQPARHRLLLMLSDGKPNDIDQYEGRYGVEDTRQAVIEARAQGIFAFCLTVDRQAPDYLPHVFGRAHYALLKQPQTLPTILVDWLRRLVAA